MKRFLFIHAVLFLTLISSKSYGDSPITSTAFYKAYKHLKIVSYAEEKGIIDKKIAKKLLSDKVSIDVKAAIINALSWDINLKSNSQILMEYLGKEYKKDLNQLSLDELNADELFCLGYLLIMDNYFNTENPLALLKMALEKNPKSYTINIIYALTYSQALLDQFAWCRIWEVCSRVKNDIALTQDLNAEANALIFDYINLYEQSCSD
jgi:hypothetical protein